MLAALHLSNINFEYMLKRCWNRAGFDKYGNATSYNASMKVIIAAEIFDFRIPKKRSISGWI
jgi:hypothetical protein